MDSQIAHSSASESGIERRALLRAGAWSVPVVAAVAAAPLAAASDGLRDLYVGGHAGETVIGFNSNKSRYFEQSITSAGQFFTVDGTDLTPAGSIFRVEWDSRLFPSGAALMVDGVSLTAFETGNTGTHGAYATFIVTQPIPVGDPSNDAGLSWSVSLGAQATVFFPADNDLHPYVTLLTPPAGVTDPNPANNGWSAAASYGGAWDVAVTASTWITVPVERTGEFPYPEDVRVVTGMTITNNGPSVAPADTTSLYIMVPSALDNGSRVTNLQAKLNNTVDADAVAALSSSYGSRILTPLEPNDVLELTWDVDLPSSYPQNGFGLGSGGAGISGSYPGDSNQSNHSAMDPGIG